MQTFSIVLVVYFMVTAGIVYDIINEPPSIGKELFGNSPNFPRFLGSFVDERGIQRPQAIMPHRINGQYILEGLVASFMFSLTGKLWNPMFMLLNLVFSCRYDYLGQDKQGTNVAQQSSHFVERWCSLRGNRIHDHSNVYQNKNARVLKLENRCRLL